MLDLTLVVTLVAVFASVALVSGTLTYVSLERSSPTRRRITDLLRPAAARQPAGGDVTQRHDAPSAFLKKVATFIPKSPRNMSKLQRRMAIAGLHKPYHPVLYSMAEVLSALIGLVLPLLIVGW